jgi:hypothetical protein
MPASKDLVGTSALVVPAELADAGVTIVEQDGRRAVIFPPELHEKFNILLPAQEVAQAVDLIRPSVRAVQLDPDFETGPHFYNQGTKAAPRLAPTKQALETLAFTAGVHLARTRPLSHEELEPYGEGAIGFMATVSIRRPDGTPLSISRAKVWQLDVEKRKVAQGHRPSWADTDEKWRAELEKRWLAEREFAPSKTETKAVLRAVRAALQIPHVFTPERAAKPFIVVGYDLALDYTDPAVVRVLLEGGEQRAAEVYGHEPPPATRDTSGEATDGTRSAAASPLAESEPSGEPAKAEASGELPQAAAPPFVGEEPPEPEADPTPDVTALVLGEVFTRYAGRSIAEVAASGDVEYLKWLASDAVSDESVRAAAKAALGPKG